MKKQPSSIWTAINDAIAPLGKMLHNALAYIIIGVLLIFGFTTFLFIGMLALGILVFAALIFSGFVYFRMRSLNKTLKRKKGSTDHDAPKMKNVTNQND